MQKTWAYNYTGTVPQFILKTYIYDISYYFYIIMFQKFDEKISFN